MRTTVDYFIVTSSFLCGCIASRPHSLLIPGEQNRKQIVEQSRMVEEASDKVWKTSSSLFQSIDKVEKAVIHAAVDAVRDEVDTLFHENHDHSDPAKVIRKSQKIAKTRCKTVSASPEEHNTLTKYPYSHGWGIY